MWIRRGPAEVDAVAVQAGISDGVHTELRPDPRSPMVKEGDRLAIGLLHPETGGKKPAVTLGKKK